MVCHLSCTGLLTKRPALRSETQTEACFGAGLSGLELTETQCSLKQVIYTHFYTASLPSHHTLAPGFSKIQDSKR